MVVKNTKNSKNTKTFSLKLVYAFCCFLYDRKMFLLNGTKNKQEIFKSMVGEMKRNERENFGYSASHLIMEVYTSNE